MNLIQPHKGHAYFGFQCSASAMNVLQTVTHMRTVIQSIAIIMAFKPCSGYRHPNAIKRIS
jgi:hypothetical protein